MLDLYSVFTARDAEEAVLECRGLGFLAHAGAIVACDPFTAYDPQPFTQRFPPGVHAVDAVFTRRRGDERIALARVLFSPAIPVRFELATRGGEDPRALAPGQIFGYGVDGGTGCFATPDAFAAHDGDALLAAHEASRKMTWSLGLALPRDGGHAMVSFSSGYGDGVYASYVGYDATGAPVCLVTDFRCVDVLLPELPDDPGFRRAQAAAAFERLRALASGRTSRSEAYEEIENVIGSALDAVPLVPKIATALRGARTEEERRLYRSLAKRLVETVEGQQAFASSFATFDEQSQVDLLEHNPLHLDPTWRAAVIALWDQASPQLKMAIVQLPPLRTSLDHLQDRAFQAQLREALAGRHDELVDVALRALAEVTDSVRNGRIHRAVEAVKAEPGHAERSEEELRARYAHVCEQARALELPVPPDLLARVRALFGGSDGDRLRSAARILANVGDDLTAALASAVPRRRLEIAEAIERATPGDDAATQAVFASLANDRGLDHDTRFEAIARIRDRSASIRAYLALGLEGHPSAAIQIRYLGGTEAIAALDALARDATSPAIRADALRCRKVVQELEDHRRANEPS